MSRVVLYRVKRPDGTPHRLAHESQLDEPALNVLISEEGYTIEPVEYIPASVARGLVEALKDMANREDDNGKPCFCWGLPADGVPHDDDCQEARAALAAAEEELG